LFCWTIFDYPYGGRDVCRETARRGWFFCLGGMIQYSHMYQKRLWNIASLWERFAPHDHHNVSHHPLYLLQEYYDRDGISIYNPDFHLVDRFDFSSSLHPVHSDEYGSYSGLQNSQLMFLPKKPIYLFDNHNKIMQPVLEFYTLTGQCCDVVHIDAHPDDAVFPQEKPHRPNLERVQEYIHQTRISDFFDFISETSLIQNIHRYTKSSDFETYKHPQKPYLLSLDIDIFGREGDFIDDASKIRVIAQAWAGADMVCIATSPGFIDQDFAREIIKIFVK
jgi:hypothetical protein